ncbi:MAG: DNA-deoxyinosine glycosylase [Clostridiales bacterium]|nr:DNA-deoxyinosine glycosylase [Clostridiales bacterium]
MIKKQFNEYKLLGVRMIQSFPPLYGKNPKILILGSIPGKASLQAEKYYNNTRNHFWSLIFEYFKCEQTDDYEIKKSLIVENGIALWDVIKCCDRENSSLDSDIKNSKPNDINQFLQDNNIMVVFLNGGKAFEEFNRNFKMSTIKVIALPSTSPANANWKKKNCQQKWIDALNEFL